MSLRSLSVRTMLSMDEGLGPKLGEGVGVAGKPRGLVGKPPREG